MSARQRLAVPLRPALSRTTALRSRRLLVWSVLWGALAVLHATQAIWVSGGQAYPGDLGDGRFNQLVLEHGYQSLHGIYHWSSPGQFYPAPDTLAFSDTHAGTLPIYVLLRAAGMSMDRAWQAWFVVVAALNAIAALRLFTALGIAPWLRGPLVFAGVSSVVQVWIAGLHMQMLPFFPGLWAWSELVLWCVDRRPHRLVAAAGCAAWQFAAGPYLAFFWLAITLAIAGARALAGGPSQAEPEGGRPPLGAAWMLAAAIATSGFALLILLVKIYAKAKTSGLTRPMSEVMGLAPDWRSWFTSPPAHLLYPAGWPGGQTDWGEHAWFSGFLPWALLAAALVAGWRWRRTPRGAWMFAAAAGSLAMVLFFTKWGEPGAGPWIAVAGKIEALRAFRGSGRIAVLLQVVEIAAAGLLLTTWQANAIGRRRGWPVVLTVLLIVESIGVHQRATPLSLARSHSDAMIAAWRKAGGRPILAFAFGYTNQPETVLHLDAWSAALRLKKVTINGYTGGLPATHTRYIWSPTVENARELIAATNLNPADISLVEGFSREDEAALGLEHYPQRPTAFLDGFSLQPSAWTLFSPLERFVVQGVPMYQFTPPAEVKFLLPDAATHMRLAQAMRAGSYDASGHSDGVGITWLVQGPDRRESVISREYFNPRDHPEHRGVVTREFSLPPGKERVLILRTDPGPAGNQAWDWPLFGKLEIR